jgi:hypothetical protein
MKNTIGVARSYARPSAGQGQGRGFTITITGGKTMLEFLDMMGNYEQRKVDRFEKDALIIDTASVTDGEHPYETGVCHPKYNDGDWVIVESYDTNEDARAGHARWVARMTGDNLPDSLDECSNAEIGRHAAAVGCKTSFARQN